MTLKLCIDPLDALRADAKRRIDEQFNREAQAFMHRDAAYAAKRQQARLVVAGGDSDQLFVEAQMRGVTVRELAETILAQPDVVAERETRRQQALASIRAETDPNRLLTVI